MNQLLKENRLHGDVAFPMALYSIEVERADIVIDCHWHREFEFLLCREGSVELILGLGETVLLKEGEALLVGSGELHAGYKRNTGRCRLCALVFSPELLYNENVFDRIKEKYLEPMMENTIRLPRLFSPELGELEKTVSSSLERMISGLSERDFGYELLVKGELYSIFYRLLKAVKNPELLKSATIAKDSTSDRLKQVMEFIYQNYADRISIGDLARLLNMSEGHFIRFFRDAVRKTPIDYINYFRVKKAVQLLQEDKKIIEVSGDVGFENVSYFVTVFKHYMGVTPGEYRRVNGKGREMEELQ